MYKVLIAEDEPRINDSIRKMIERLDDEFQVSASVYNGDDAIAWLMAEKADVVFTDIQMPGTDGIQLLKYMDEHCPHVVPVVISGYEVFEYVRKSLKYHALDYLLKPFSMDDMKEILEKVRRELEKKEAQRRKEYAQRIFSRESKETEEKREDEGNRYQMCLINLGSLKDMSGYEISEGRYRAAENYLEGKLAPREKYKTFCFQSYQASQYILVAEFEETDKRLVKGFFKEVYEKLNEGEFPVTMIVSKEFSQMNQLYHTFWHLRKTMKERLIFGYSSFIWQEREERQEADAGEVEEICSQMQEYQDRPGERTAELLKRCEQERCTQRALERILRKEYIDILNIFGEKSGFSYDIVEKEILTSLEQTDCYEELLKELTEVEEILEKGNAEEEEELVECVKSYLKKNIAKKILMKDLAKDFGFVPSYFSMLFRNAEGKSPTEYLMDLRLEWAKKILKQEITMPVREVAERVGFQDALYFSKVFKKKTGMTPSRFREDGGG